MSEKDSGTARSHAEDLGNLRLVRAVELGHELLRRDDAVALLDPLAEERDGQPPPRTGTVTQPDFPSP